MCRTSPNSSSAEKSHDDLDFLSQAAIRAVREHEQSHIEMGMKFCKVLSSTTTTSTTTTDENDQEQQEQQQYYRAFIGTSADRLIKLGRSLENLVDMYASSSANERGQGELKKLQASLQRIAADICLLAMAEQKTKESTQKPHSSVGGGGGGGEKEALSLQVPRVAFGKTHLQMPIVTLGCMRFQQEWGPRIQHFNDGPIGGDCQDNLMRILKRAIIDYGMVHIETARFYGCSELQLGVALKQLFWTNQVQRSDLILQTKVPAQADPAVFRRMLQESFTALQLDEHAESYLDLFAFHGLNFEEHLEYIFGTNNKSDDKNETAVNCMQVVQEYVQAGKIRHVGFSTHGATSLIYKAIATNQFDYVNIHYHYFGSYTASGDGKHGTNGKEEDEKEATVQKYPGNLDCIKLASRLDMGIFIISPFDKGGKLYTPSRQLRDLCLPEMEPMEFGSQWIWNHHDLVRDDDNDDGKINKLQLHTYTVGAARPSDLDEPALAAFHFKTKQSETLQRVQTVVQRLEAQKLDALGEDWIKSWWKGLTKARDLSKQQDDNPNAHFIEHGQIIWLYNTLKAFGMYGFCKDRYNSFQSNAKKWDKDKTPEENIQAIPKMAWGFVPGLPLLVEQEHGGDGDNGDDVDYFQNDLKAVPPENRARIREAHEFILKWLVQTTAASSSSSTPTDKKDATEEDSKKKGNSECIPKEWETAIDLRTWPDFPDQPSRAPK